jgi:hypothetical protein
MAGRLIGKQTVTHCRDFYDRSRKGWYRLETVFTRVLHSTKGWRRESERKSETHITYLKASRPFTNITFERW